MSFFELTFDARVFSLDTVKRALYRNADIGTFDVCLSKDTIHVTFKGTDGETLLGKIKRDVLDQDLRESIAKETTAIRTLILANAFSNSGLIQ